MDDLVGRWEVSSWWTYVALVLLCQLFIRGFMSGLKAVEQAAQQRPMSFGAFKEKWKWNFIGIHPSDPKSESADYWFPAILGTLELGTYPIVMATGAWTIVGAWIGLKTLSQWASWGPHRSAFNRYLIGNALTVIMSLLVLVQFVTVK